MCRTRHYIFLVNHLKYLSDTYTSLHLTNSNSSSDHQPTLLEIRVLQGFFANTYNKPYTMGFFTLWKALHAVKNPLFLRVYADHENISPRKHFSQCVPMTVGFDLSSVVQLIESRRDNHLEHRHWFVPACFQWSQYETSRSHVVAHQLITLTMTPKIEIR
jgi:hypothetical protein